jgi:hypothetical protein
MTGPMALSALLAGPGERPTVPLEPTSVYVFETRTGRVIDQVPIIGAPRWNGGIATPGSWSVTVALRGKAQGAGLDPTTFESLTASQRFSWAITQGSNIWQAGPIVSENWAGGSSTAVTGGGLWQLLNTRRVLINPARASDATVTGNDADVIFGPTGYTPVIGGTVIPGGLDLSLHTIAKRIVQTIMGEAGGDYPVVFPADIAGSSIREYAGYDMAYAGARLNDLTQVVNGPEIVFKPEFVDGTTKQAIQWRMQIGNPALGLLTYPWSWDSGRALCGVTSFTTDGSTATTRAFERGNGMGRDTPVGYADAALNPLDTGAVLLENVGSNHTSATDVNTLNSYAQNAVDFGKAVTSTLKVRVRTAGDDGQGFATRTPHQAEVNYGDNGILQIRNSPRLPDGAYKVRIIGKESTDSAHEMLMNCQLISRELR